MPVRKHGKGWQARVQYLGNRVERTFRSRADALDFERRTRGRIADRRVGRQARYSLEEALHRWLTGEARTLRTEHDLQNKARSLLPHIAGRALEDVANAAESATRAWLADGLKPATINRRLAILRRVVNLAHRQWGWLENPVAGRVQLLPGERARHVYLSPAEVQRLVAAARDRRVRNAILLAATSGLRRSELLALDESSRRGNALYVQESKSGRPRLVPLPPEALDISLPLGLTVHELRNGFDRARAKAKMPHIRFHDLRHTYASWLVQAGAPLAAVRDLLGHSNLGVSSRYAHLATAHLEEAVGKIAGLARVTKTLRKHA